MINDRPRPSATAIRSNASTTHSGSIEIPRHNMTPKISARYMTLLTRISRGRRASTRSASAGADNRHRCHLDSYGKTQSFCPARDPGVPASLAEHIHDQIRRAVDDLRLIAEVIG